MGNAHARHSSLHPQLVLRASFAVRSDILPAKSSEGWNPILIDPDREQISELLPSFQRRLESSSAFDLPGKIKNWTPAFAGVTSYLS